MRVRSGAPSSPAPLPPHTSRPAGPRRTRAFVTVLDERIGAPPSPTPPANAAPVPARPPPATPARTSPSPVGALLERTLAAENRVDTLLAAAARGKTFSPAELLALQASVFRYSQAVEVVSRATDKLVGAVKQTMGTQV